MRCRHADRRLSYTGFGAPGAVLVDDWEAI
jgi:hypothetical protein